MRYVWIPALFLGIAVGWFARDLTFEKTQARTDADRSSSRAGETAPDGAGGETPAGQPAAGKTTEARGDSDGAELAAPEPQEEDGAAETAAEEAAGSAEAASEDDPIRKMVKSQGAMWKGWATMQAKQKLPALLEALGLDPEATQQVEEALLADVDRKVELALLMMIGEEDLDTDAFAYFMGMPPDLSPELEQDLATFLGDQEIGNVRTEVKKAYKKQLDDMAEMQLSMMAVPDLSDDQRTRLKEVYSGKDYMKEQFSQFASATRDRGALKALMADPSLLKDAMKQNFEPTRRRVRDILNDEQFKKYETYEQGLIQQAEMGVRMMSGMLEQADRLKSKQPETKKPDGQ